MIDIGDIIAHLECKEENIIPLHDRTDSHHICSRYYCRHPFSRPRQSDSSARRRWLLALPFQFKSPLSRFDRNMRSRLRRPVIPGSITPLSRHIDVNIWNLSFRPRLHSRRPAKHHESRQDEGRYIANFPLDLLHRPSRFPAPASPSIRISSKSQIRDMSIDYSGPISPPPRQHRPDRTRHVNRENFR